MNMITPDALRRAMETLRAGGLSDANTLVQATLARHGLAGQNLPPMQPLQAAQTKAKTPVGFPARWAARPTNGPGKRQHFKCAAGSRDYVMHLPESAGNSPRGLVLMLHGCTQTPEDFSTGTGMNAHADTAGLILVYPAQSRGDNAQSCWNWFSGADQQHGRGEPAILAGLVRDVAARYDVPEGMIFVAGLSAGAAMAVILGRTYPEVFAGVGAHSGLPYGCARGVTEAFAAVSGQSTAIRSKPTEQPIPTIVFHGNADATVAKVNGQHIFEGALGRAESQTEIVDDGMTGGRSFNRTTVLGPNRAVMAEHWRIDGLGHAWSGGNPAGSYADAQGPDASAEMVRFFLSIAPGASR